MFVAVKPVGAGQLVVHGNVVNVTDGDHGLNEAAPVELMHIA
jgi:hypothetical protein